MIKLNRIQPTSFQKVNPIKQTNNQNKLDKKASKASTIEKKDDQLSPEERKHVEALKQIERKVTAHERAHKSVGGQFAGSMSFSYTQGPDGKRYKTGGEVSISIPNEEDPERAIQMLMQVKRAALAPADPSSQDIKVASMVDAKIQVARQKMAKAYQQEISEKSDASNETISEKNALVNKNSKEAFDMKI